MTRLDDLPPDLPIRNCACCLNMCITNENAIIFFGGDKKLPYKVRLYGGQVNGRPYCENCIATREPPAGRNSSWRDDASPAQENAIRAAEDAPGG